MWQQTRKFENHCEKQHSYLLFQSFFLLCVAGVITSAYRQRFVGVIVVFFLSLPNNIYVLTLNGY